MPAFQQLAVEGAIVHRVFRRATKVNFKKDPATDKPPDLTDTLVDLSPDLETFFQRRLVATMKEAYEVRFDPDANPTMAGLVCAALRDPKADLAPASPGMAVALHEAQDASNPEGLLVAIHGAVASRPFVAVMKLEHERGVHSHLETLPDGSRQYQMELQTHVLGDKTRVFKAGLFFLPVDFEVGSDQAPDPVDVAGWVSDDQSGLGGDPVARFFRYDYLGCEFTANSALETMRFLDAAEGWINSLPDGEKKTRYEVALISEVSSEKGTITPRQIAQDHFEEDDRQRFLDALTAKGSGTARMKKEKRLIRNRIRMTSVTTAKNVKILANQAQFGDGTVTVVHGATDELDEILVRDDISDVRGR